MKRCTRACYEHELHSTLQCTVSLPHLAWSGSNFGSAWASCSHLVLSYSPPFDSFLFVLLSLFQSDILDYPACTHSLSAKSVRCQFLSDHLLQDHEFFSLFSLPYLTNALLFLFYTSYDHLSHGVKRVAQRISIPFPSLLLSFQITPYRSKASLILLYSKRRYKELSCI